MAVGLGEYMPIPVPEPFSIMSLVSVSNTKPAVSARKVSDMMSRLLLFTNTNIPARILFALSSTPWESPSNRKPHVLLMYPPAVGDIANQIPLSVEPSANSTSTRTPAISAPVTPLIKDAWAFELTNRVIKHNKRYFFIRIFLKTCFTLQASLYFPCKYGWQDYGWRLAAINL